MTSWTLACSAARIISSSVADWRRLLARVLLRLIERRQAQGWFSLQVWVEYLRRPRAISNPAQLLRERFPEEVRAWGGPGVLEDAAAVRRLVEETDVTRTTRRNED